MRNKKSWIVSICISYVKVFDIYIKYVMLKFNWKINIIKMEFFLGREKIFIERERFLSEREEKVIRYGMVS